MAFPDYEEAIYGIRTPYFFGNFFSTQISILAYGVVVECRGIQSQKGYVVYYDNLIKHERGIMMEQRLVATRQIPAENGNLLVLQYFLLKEGTSSEKQKFGVMILEQSSGEKALVPNLSTSAARVFRLIHRLADCTVTPTTLLDVLTDWEGTL